MANASLRFNNIRNILIKFGPFVSVLLGIGVVVLGFYWAITGPKPFRSYEDYRLFNMVAFWLVSISAVTIGAILVDRFVFRFAIPRHLYNIGEERQKHLFEVFAVPMGLVFSFSALSMLILAVAAVVMEPQ